MKIAVIADDLTGACDTGVQLVQYGLSVSVSIENNKNDLNSDKNAIIFNTDSRSLSEEQSYSRVKDVCQQIVSMNTGIVYKKIDSTMRGNIGAEINAVYDVFQPDFVLITPAHPSNGREVKDELHYLNGMKLHETEVANDPKTPVEDSNIKRLIQNKSGRSVKHLTYKELRKGKGYILEQLRTWKQQGISYVTSDAIDERDLECLIEVIDSEYSTILCGSAGLINYLPKTYGYSVQERKLSNLANGKPLLFVVGSVSKVGRKQLNNLLSNPGVVGVEMNSARVIEGTESKKEEIRDLKNTIETLISNNKSVALFSSSDLDTTQRFGKDHGMGAVEVSNIISTALGDITIQLVDDLKIQNLFLTGGDTAQQVLSRLSVSDYELMGELELGVPIGKVDKQDEIFVITKAGSFGTDSVMTNTFHKLVKKIEPISDGEC